MVYNEIDRVIITIPCEDKKNNDEGMFQKGKQEGTGIAFVLTGD